MELPISAFVLQQASVSETLEFILDFGSGFVTW